jgi:hypothetical protein
MLRRVVLVFIVTAVKISNLTAEAVQQPMGSSREGRDAAQRRQFELEGRRQASLAVWLGQEGELVAE